MDAHIRIEDVRKVYRSGKDEVEAVSRVSFSVEAGEFVAILGPSGCGKSTLLMMCAGLEPVTSGAGSIDGATWTAPRARVAVMFQDSTLLPWKTPLENILYPVRIHNLPLAEFRYRAHDVN